MASSSVAGAVLPFEGTMGTQVREDRAYETNQDSGLQEPVNMLVNIALVQDWSFAKGPADVARPESSSSGTIQDTSKSSISDSFPQEVPHGAAHDESSDDEGLDILTAIRHCKTRGIRPVEKSAASRTLAPPALRKTKMTAGTKTQAAVQQISWALNSRFLNKYDHSGQRPQNIKATESTEKRPAPEIIDLTGPDPVITPREGKRRKLHKHGREKRHKSAREGSQTRDSVKNGAESTSRSHRKRHRDALSSRSRRRRRHDHHRSSEGRRQPNGESSQQLSQIPQGGAHQQVTPQATQQPTQNVTQQVAQQPTHQLSPETPQQVSALSTLADLSKKPRVEIPLERGRQGKAREPSLALLSGPQGPQGGNDFAFTRHAFDREVINAIKHRPITAGDKASARVEQTKSTHGVTKSSPAVGGYLSAPDLEAEAEFCQGLFSKLPEKRTTQLASNFPSTDKQPNFNSHRGAGERHPRPRNPLPASRPPLFSPTAGPNRQASLRAPSRSIFQPRPTHNLPLRPRHLAGANDPHTQTVVPPPLRPPKPSLKPAPRPQAQPVSPSPPSLRAHKPSFNPAPRPQPRPASPSPPPRREIKTITALEALGPDRITIRYVVYRTPRKDTTSGATHRLVSASASFDTDPAQRDAVKVRCGVFHSLALANADVKARVEKPLRGVVGRHYDLVQCPSPFTSIFSSFEEEQGRQQGVWLEEKRRELCKGSVKFDDGVVQHFWVEEETKELNDETARGLKLDREAVKVYGWPRERFDVWAFEFKPKVVKSKGPQRIVFECGVDGDRDGSEEGRLAEEQGGMEELSDGDGSSGIEDGDGSGHVVEMVDAAPTEEEEHPAEGDSSGPEAKDNTDGQQIDPDLQPAGGITTAAQDGDISDDESDDENTSDDDSADEEEPEPLPVVAARRLSTPPPSLPRGINPFALFDMTPRFCSTHTTAAEANRAAFDVFLELAKPKNLRIDDHSYYQKEVVDDTTKDFEASGVGESGTNIMVELEWEVPEYMQSRWRLLWLSVQVVSGPLQGPVDLGDMVVEEASQDGEGGKKAQKPDAAHQSRQVMGGTRSCQVEGALPSPVATSQTEEEGEVSDEEEGEISEQEEGEVSEEE